MTQPKNGLGGMLVLSLALHLVLFFLSTKLALFTNGVTVQEAIYVDVLNMPVESPQAGSPVGTEKDLTAAARPPAPRSPPRHEEMKLPPAKPPAAKTAPTVPRQGERPETARDYEARLAALERAAEARRQEAALADIQSRVASGTRGGAASGMPGGTGSQAGSDYASYIQSRLRDAFEVTIAWQTKSPMMVVRILVGPQGGLKSYKIEKSTGDVVFEDSVDRAIHLAKKNFPPPPGGREFTYGFVFRPEGVNRK